MHELFFHMHVNLYAYQFLYSEHFFSLFWLMVQSSNSKRRYAEPSSTFLSHPVTLRSYCHPFPHVHLEDVCCILYFLNTHYALLLLFAFHNISGRLSRLCTSESLFFHSSIASPFGLMYRFASSNNTEVFNLI